VVSLAISYSFDDYFPKFGGGEASRETVGLVANEPMGETRTLSGIFLTSKFKFF